MRRRDLEAALENVPTFPDPDPTKEQYRTPPGVAAALLWEATQDDAIEGRSVLDLGCGTGMFAHGASLMGAASVHGVDQDAAAVALAQALVPAGTFEVADLADWTPPSVETVLMNPPFGAQDQHADRIFHDRAAQAVRERQGTVWFLQQPRNEKFLARYYGDLGLALEKVGEWDYPIPATFAFHSEDVGVIRVGGYTASF